MAVSPRRSSAARRTWRTLAAIGVLAAAACGKDSGSPAAPQLPGDPPIPPQYRVASFIMDVDVRNKKVVVRSPNASVNGPALGIGPRQGGPSLSVDGPNLSLLGGDVVELQADSMVAGPLGGSVPGKVRYTFRLSITNRLPGIELITPTWPTPPVGSSGVVIFPFETATITSTGGISVGGEGNEVIVEAPSYGAVTPSTDWDNAPHNFFNDEGCGAGSNDCFRSETFNPIPGLATSETRVVGIDADPTVGNFRVRMIVAANLRAAATPLGSIAGTVSSPQRGSLSGVRVIASTGREDVSDATGAYSIDSVNVGPRTVSLDGATLPAGCTNPGPQSVTVTNGATSTANFSVTCPVPSGTVSGTISSSLGGGISGIAVTITPTGGSGVSAGTTPAAGTFSASVPVGATGDGQITLANVPANCTNAGPYAYSGLTEGGSVVRNVTLTCTPPPAFYQYTQTWTTEGAQKVLTITFDPSTYNDPAINGANADDFNSIDVETFFDQTKLTVSSVSDPSSAPVMGVTFNSSIAGKVIWNSQYTASANGLVAPTQVLRIVFDVVSGATGSVTTSTLVKEAVSFDGSIFDLSKVQVTEATVTLP